MRHLYIVGACGSIGRQTLDIVRNNKEEFKVVGLAVGSNKEIAVKLIEEFKPEVVCFKEGYVYELSYKPVIFVGDKGLEELAAYSKYEDEVFVNALVGMSGIMPTVCAIKAKKTIALANKETLVAAGDLINDLVNKYNVPLVPIDSEHSAILQCLTGESKKEVKRLIITASGGSFRDKKREELIGVTKEAALKHPNWSMGAKITIDSATMMNKGFEVIEAHHLFHIPYEKIDTILHKESIVHSLVEFNDGTIKAELGSPDMHTPIAYALRYPHHLQNESDNLDLIGLNLHFEELSDKRYPCLGYAYLAAKKGGIYPAILNAANEAAVKLFLLDKIEFLEIEKIIYDEITNKKYETIPYTLENVVSISLLVIKEILKKFGVD